MAQTTTKEAGFMETDTYRRWMEKNEHLNISLDDQHVAHIIAAGNGGYV
jgi:hypothetical protein